MSRTRVFVLRMGLGRWTRRPRVLSLTQSFIFFVRSTSAFFAYLPLGGRILRRKSPEGAGDFTRVELEDINHAGDFDGVEVLILAYFRTPNDQMYRGRWRPRRDKVEDADSSESRPWVKWRGLEAPRGGRLGEGSHGPKRDLWVGDYAHDRRVEGRVQEARAGSQEVKMKEPAIDYPGRYTTA